MENVVNPFGRVNENVYLPKLENGKEVKFNNRVVSGTGKIVGVASEGVAVMGKTYVIEFSTLVDVNGVSINYEYPTISMPEFFIGL